MSSAAPAGKLLPVTEPAAPAPARVPVLPEAVTILAGFAGIGAGTLSFGISSTLLSASLTPGTITGAGVTVLWGIGLMVWAVQSLRRGSPAWFRAVLRTVPVAVVLHLAAVAVGIWAPGPAPRFLDGAALSAAALELMILGSVGWLARQPTPGAGPAPVQPAPGPLLAAIFAAALIVATITTPGLAATAAGDHAVPHGEHTSAHLSPPTGHHH
ncbi:hypothetical protein J7I84_06935 [Arthrobacter sp. ISL-85]|uniref:hypothetical protein n=1 Tax=Arthrobacter sp. ISL-85 TaxID=2819115 RepID=UPI001BED39BF|nr:hypothetical protein [Arthrobacter sp. ISL-85]MBT2566235.1 hypothetical protein [Arthrobacter sp. ISL-85]